MSNPISASALERLDVCAASGVLPRVYHDSPAGERGTEIHAYLKRLAQSMPRDQALALVPEPYRATCAELPDPGPGIAEVAFAYDVVSGRARELGRDIEREYGKLAATEIPGSADLLQIYGAQLFVIDYKTGHTEVPPARENLQLHFLALCVARVYGGQSVTVVLRHIHEDGGIHEDRHVLDAFDLAEVAARVRKIHDRVGWAKAKVQRGETPDLHEGAHCKYCPARLACPAKVGMLVRLTVPQGVQQKFTAMLTPESAAQAYAIYQRADEVMRDLRAQLDDYARVNPIALPDGKVYGLTTYERESVVGSVAREVLARLHGQAVADAACEWSSTKAAIERALKEVAPRGSLAQYKRKAEEEIRKAGGIETKVTETVKVHEKPEEEARRGAANG